MQSYSSDRDYDFPYLFLKTDDSDAVYAYGNYSYINHKLALWNDLYNKTTLPFNGVWADVNGDGLADVLPTNGWSSSDYMHDVYLQKEDGTFEKQQIEITKDASELNTLAISNYTPGCRLPGLSDGMFVKSPARPTFLYADNDSESAAKRSSMKIVAADSEGYDSSDTYAKDMNGDGLVDIVTSSYVFYNFGNNRFFRSAHVGKIYSADVNGDGINDYVDFGNDKVTLYMTLSDGSFDDGKLLFENSAMQNVFFGDFDRDGDVDLLFFIPNETVTYLVFYRNDGNGVFKRKETYIDGKYTSYTCKDYDGDGLYEIVASSGEYNNDDCLVKCDLKNGNATVTALDETDKENSKYGGAIVVGDFDNDGITEYGYPLPTDQGFAYGTIPCSQKNTAPDKMQKPTVRFFDDSGKLCITWQRGTDAQTSPCDLTYELRIGSQPGKGDIVYANSLADGRRRNLFSGNMGTALGYMLNADRLAAGKYYIAVQAIDAGGMGGAWSDECVYEHTQSRPSMALLPAKISAGDTLQLHVSRPLSGAKYTWHVENGAIIGQDADGSNAQALFRAAGVMKVTVDMELGGRTYSSREKTLKVLPFKNVYDVYYRPISFAFDADQDGIAELSASEKLFHLDADGNKMEIKKSFNSDLSRAVTAIDVDNDGYPDFLTGGSSKNVYVNSGEQDCDFEIFTSSEKYYGLGSALDYNNDGKLDFDNHAFNVTPVGTYLPLFDKKNIKGIVSDFNGDGYWDLVSKEFQSTSDVTVSLKAATPNVSDEYEDKTALTGWSGYSLIGVADLNSDGYPDFILSNSSKRVVVKGKPVEQWPCTDVVMKFDEGRELYFVGDLDNNGYPDIVAGPSSSGIIPVGGDDRPMSIYLMQPDFKFTKIGVDKEFVENSGIAKTLLWQPFFPGGYANGTKSHIPNEAPSAPENLRASITDKGMLLQWDAAKDDRTPAAQMRYNISVKYKNKKVGEKDAFLISPLNGLSDKAAICSNMHYRKATQMLVPLDVLKSGETYEVQVQAIDLMGEHSPMTKAVEIKANTSGSMKAAQSLVETGKECDVEFVGTRPSAYTVTAGADATVKDKGNGRVSVSWKTGGKKTVTLTADGCAFSTQVKVFDAADLALGIPAKVLKNAPLTVKLPSAFFGEDVKAYAIDGASKIEKCDTAVVLTFCDAGQRKVMSDVTLADDSHKTYTYVVNVSAEDMPAAEITGVLADGNNYRVNWNTNVPQMADRMEVSRETSSAGEFEVVATVPVAQGAWTDTKSDNRIQAQRYRIRLLAAGGKQAGASSAAHKPLHVMVCKGAPKGYNLMWNAYEGMDIESYSIMRGTTPDNLTAIAKVAGSQQSYTDLNAPEGTCYYAVGFTPSSAQHLSGKRAASSGAWLLSNAVSTADAANAVAVESVVVGMKEELKTGTYSGDCRFHLTAGVLPANATNTAVKWSIVSGEEIAHISADGVLTSRGQYNGDVTVRAEAADGSGAYGEKTITMKGFCRYDDIDLLMPKSTLVVGERMQVTPVVYPDYMWIDRLFVTPKSDCITLGSDNVVTAVKLGKAEIRLGAPGSHLYKSVYITVVSPTGIRGVKADGDGPTRYYNVEGMRVVSPIKGRLYITDKGEKVIF